MSEARPNAATRRRREYPHRFCIIGHRRQTLLSAIDSVPALTGRKVESEALDRLVAGARGGTSAALVLTGEAGVGKSALLEYIVSRADGFRVARADGVETEMELAYAGLHQVCAPFLDRIDALPPPQRDALGTAFGRGVAGLPDRFLVGLAALTLLADAAGDQRVLCVLDDAQWLDRVSLQVLAFVARRIGAEGVVIVFTVREPEADLAGLPQLVIRPLRDDDARALLAAAVPGKLDDAVRDWIVAEARGNPLALMEVPRVWTPAMLAGGFGVPIEESAAVGSEESFAARLDTLPAPSRQLLLLAASECVGDSAVIWRAAAAEGIAADAATAAAQAGLLEDATQLRFRHPLVRSVVYREAPIGDRQRAHHALADATDPDLVERRAWHRGLAAPGPDDEIALELERSAELAQRRGGLAAAAAVLGRSAELTLDPTSRGERALAAARATHAAGSPEAARAWLATAEAQPLEPLQRARAQLLRGQIAFTLSRGSDAPPLLLGAARQLEGLDPVLARETYLDALTAAQFAGFLASGSAREIAESARATPAPLDPRPADVLLDGLSLLLTVGRPAATPVLRHAVDAFVTGDVARTEGYRWLWLAAVAALELWDADSWFALTERHVTLVRDAGALSMLPLALTTFIYAGALDGDLAGADALVHEAQSVHEAIGNPMAPYGALVVAAWRGRATEVATLSAAIVRDAEPRGEGLGITTTQWANALLQNSVGGYAHALRSARQAVDRPSELTLASKLALVEMVEAAARTSQSDLATDALDRLAAMAATSDSDWGLGLEARSRALLLGDGGAEPMYREAVERLGRTRLRGELARAHLVYGEWLRRANRRVDARRELRAAHEIFTAIGADAFAERARGELLATGETVRKRTDDTRDELTPQELQIARLASGGETNPEIAAQLFLSPRTVEWHLRKVFAKLGVTSRRELRTALPRPVAAVSS